MSSGQTALFSPYTCAYQLPAALRLRCESPRLQLLEFASRHADIYLQRRSLCIEPTSVRQSNKAVAMNLWLGHAL